MQSKQALIQMNLREEYFWNLDWAIILQHTDQEKLDMHIW